MFPAQRPAFILSPPLRVSLNMLQLAENPPLTYSHLSGELLSDADWEQPWRIAYTRPRQEKSLAHDLVEREITYFLPMVLRQTSSGGRRRRNMYPLFPSYLFFAGDDEARLSCLRTERLVRVFEPNATQREQFTRELRSLATSLHVAPDKVQLYNRLKPGVRVWIKSGPMRGVEGTIVEFADATRKLQLSVSLLGVGALVDIHPDLVDCT